MTSIDTNDASRERGDESCSWTKAIVAGAADAPAEDSAEHLAVLRRGEVCRLMLVNRHAVQGEDWIEGGAR